VLSPSSLPAWLGIALMVGLGALMLTIALSVKRMVLTTHDFIIADRRIGLGFGVGSVIAIWTWSMAVMLSSAQAYTWGTSGLLWFVVPNGLAVIAMVPFAVHLRRRMPTGYTIVEFIRERFQTTPATLVMLVAMIFLLLGSIFLNLFGVVLVTGVVFGLDKTVVLLLTIAIVTVYAYFGGLWTSTITATMTTLLVTVPAAVVVLYVLHKAGGAGFVFERVKDAGPEKLEVLRGDTAASFGLTFALGLLAVSMADQAFWQKAWAMRPQNLARTFIWAGLWFYPIPLCLGLLGFVGIAAGVGAADLGAFGTGGVGPYVVSHLGLPVLVVALYVLIIVNACYSAMDGAFSALSSLVAIDIVKRVRPDVGERTLFRLTKVSIPVAGLVGAIVVSSGIDYVKLVNVTFFVDSSLIIPLGLAIFWPRYTSRAFIASVLLAVAIGVPIRETVSELWGLVALLGVSLLVSVTASLLQRERFDYRRLRRQDELDGLAKPQAGEPHGPPPAVEAEAKPEPAT